MAASLEKVGQANGIRFNSERRVHNTIRSHRLVRFADAQDKGDQMIEQLFHGYFEEGKNIADVGVLLELAQKVLKNNSRNLCNEDLRHDTKYIPQSIFLLFFSLRRMKPTLDDLPPISLTLMLYTPLCCFVNFQNDPGVRLKSSIYP